MKTVTSIYCLVVPSSLVCWDCLVC